MGSRSTILCGIALIAASLLTSNPGRTGERLAAMTAAASREQTSPGAKPLPAVVIHIRAEKSRYDPSSIRVKAGSNVELHIVAVDRAHGLLINSYPDKAATSGAPGLVFEHPQNCWKIEKGQEAVIRFTARQPGTYAFRCCVFCGFGHLGMKGELVVEP